MNSEKEIFWKSPNNIRIPDFMICGAMKSGTTTVHSILDKHPGIFMPKKEINFFDIDDILQHPDLFSYKNRWFYPRISEAPDKYWRWYQRLFEDAKSDQLIGEDSTCYLPSTKAPARIALQTKPIKTIICLRNPADRAYSQYWHNIRAGRAILSFEDTIRFTPYYALSRSMYLEQIERFLHHIPRERVFFFILEEFLENKEKTMQSLANFLNLDSSEFPTDTVNTHANRTKFPKNIKLQIKKNRLFHSIRNTNYLGDLPFETAPRQAKPFLLRTVEKFHRKVNPLVERRTPPMHQPTREFLEDLFKRELAGLDEIINFDINHHWFNTTSSR